MWLYLVTMCGYVWFRVVKVRCIDMPCAAEATHCAPGINWPIIQAQLRSENSTCCLNTNSAVLECRGFPLRWRLEQVANARQLLTDKSVFITGGLKVAKLQTPFPFCFLALIAVTLCSLKPGNKKGRGSKNMNNMDHFKWDQIFCCYHRPHSMRLE